MFAELRTHKEIQFGAADYSIEQRWDGDTADPAVDSSFFRKRVETTLLDNVVLPLLERRDLRHCCLRESGSAPLPRLLIHVFYASLTYSRQPGTERRLYPSNAGPMTVGTQSISVEIARHFTL